MRWALNCLRCGVLKTKKNTYYDEKRRIFYPRCVKCSSALRQDNRENRLRKDSGVKRKRGRPRKEENGIPDFNSFEEIKKIADKLYKKNLLTRESLRSYFECSNK